MASGSRLWREKRCEIAPEDLSRILPVMLGSWTEAFNRQWYEQETGLQVSRVGAVEICADHPWRRCTLDGFVAAKGAVFEAKHVGAFRKPEDVVEGYMPQLQHNQGAGGVSAPRVYAAISAITAELAQTGIAKSHTNARDQYAYRSIDDVTARLAPLLAKHRLCILPRVAERTCEERSGLGGALLVRVALRAAFDLVSGRDGSSHTVEAYGEALDTGDKATSKAMSAAFKQALLQTFCAELERRRCRFGEPQARRQARPTRSRPGLGSMGGSSALMCAEGLMAAWGSSLLIGGRSAFAVIIMPSSIKSASESSSVGIPSTWSPLPRDS